MREIRHRPTESNRVKSSLVFFRWCRGARAVLETLQDTLLSANVIVIVGADRSDTRKFSDAHCYYLAIVIVDLSGSLSRAVNLSTGNPSYAGTISS